MMKKILLALVVSLFILPLGVSAQEYWAKDIAKFRQQDSLHGVKKGGILFVGSSTFTMWKDINSWFPEYPITNRGFGGSKLRDVLYYYQDLVVPHQPKQIVVYEGDNDLETDKYAVDDYLRDVECFIRLSQIKFPGVDICIVSIKPSPARVANFGRYREANKRVAKLCDKLDGVRYIDIWDAMHDAKGKINESLFIGDRLHLSKQGYEVWYKAIKPFLLKP